VLLVFLALAVAPPLAARADDGFMPCYKPTLEVSRAPGPIRIDGELDDPGWQSVARARNFAEHSPGDAIQPPVESEAWVTYDDENLYVALIAYDDPATVRVTLCERDRIFSDDYFGIMFDTYGDLAWGYEFFVNPLGIQGDLRVNGDGSEEMSFDLVWESRGKVTDSGYQVELAVPFASLRFPDRDEQVWRFNVWRDHQRAVRRRYTWAAIDRDMACWMCQWGTLTGIRGIRPGSNIDLIASGVGYQTSGREDPFDPCSPFETENADGRLSLNVRYGLSSSSSAELTLNPDFSQIESDAGQIDVNSTFALFYPERRPFFQEGSDLYNTWINAIHTRTLNDPQAAVKFTGTFGRTTLLYLLARDRNSPILIPGEEGSFQPLVWNGIRDLKSVSNVLRMRRTLLEDSYVGATFTDRRFEDDHGGAGTLFGIDGRIRFLGNCHLELQAMMSHSEEPDDTLLTEGINDLTFDGGEYTYGFDGEAFWGHGIYASLERDTRNWGLDFDYWEYSPTFRTDNGFTTRNDYRRTVLVNRLHFRPNRSLLVEWGPGLRMGRFWNHRGEFKEDWIAPWIWLGLIGQTNLSLNLWAAREVYAGQRFDNLASVSVDINTVPIELLRIGGVVERSRTIYRTTEDPRLANGLFVHAWASIKPLQRLVIAPSVTYFRLDERHGGANIFDGSIVRTRVNLQFTRELYARVIVQYNSFADRLDLEPLLTYRINPFTVFYLGASSSHVDFPEGAGAADDSGEGVPRAGLPEARWKPVGRQYFAKIQYLWRI
jgi:hypothetical protein